MSDAPHPIETDVRHAIRQFGLAVTALAIGNGTLQDRLDAAITHLLGLQADDLPERLRAQFEELESSWLAVDVSAAGNTDVETIARTVLALEAELLAMYGARYGEVIRGRANE